LLSQQVGFFLAITLIIRFGRIYKTYKNADFFTHTQRILNCIAKTFELLTTYFFQHIIFKRNNVMFTLSIKYLGKNLKERLNKINNQNQTVLAPETVQTYTDPASKLVATSYLPTLLEHNIYAYKEENYSESNNKTVLEQVDRRFFLN